MCASFIFLQPSKNGVENIGLPDPNLKFRGCNHPRRMLHRRKNPDKLPEVSTLIKISERTSDKNIVRNDNAEKFPPLQATKIIPKIRQRFDNR